MDETNRRPFIKRLFAISPFGILRLIAISVGVGLVLALLNIDPATVWSDFFGTFARAWVETWHALSDAANWAFDYFILGAILVVPIFVILRIVKALRK
ncbi:MAG: DUF6460 domain-containing protein [Robiginitomaculum sp.]|nr:DUF6460 domain-containing protein [Robiginitomaculum sp.]MDQ7077964.1 DUF6460 domain-containing protein [Robiginitomaculum sp.]